MGEEGRGREGSRGCKRVRNTIQKRAPVPNMGGVFQIGIFGGIWYQVMGSQG